MKKTDQDFYNYALNRPSSPDVATWLKEMYADYIAGLHCEKCNGRNIKIIIDPKAIIWCKDCGEYSENVTIDKIPKMNYNTVTFLHEDKIKEIFKAQELE